MHDIELVVARHEEDLGWLRRVPRGVKVTVYNKGASMPNAVPLPNIGREAHTYLHHLVERYDTLAAWTLFCQGRPFDHVPDFHRTLRKLAAEPPPSGDFAWWGFIIDQDDRTGSRLFMDWSKNTNRRPLDMATFWAGLWSEPCPDTFTFFLGAHFGLGAALAQRQPRSFYEQALRISATLPDAAHCFERCWDRVFRVDGIPPAWRGKPLPLYLRPVRRLGITWEMVPPEARPFS